MKFFHYFIIALAILSTTNCAQALYGNFEEFNQPEDTQQQELIIPEGSFFRGYIGQTVSSEFNNNGDLVKILITSDFTIKDKVILPKNSIFLGVISGLEKAQQGRDGMFSIDITNILFPDGKTLKAQGYVVSSKKDRVFGGGLSKRSGHKSSLHRSVAFGRKGTLQLLQNGPRKVGEETKIQMGQFVTILIEKPINVD